MSPEAIPTSPVPAENRPQAGIDGQSHRALYEAILPYLPPMLIQEVLATADVSPIRHTFYQGSVLFVDVAGFSSISEALSISGKTGAEEMTEILNRYFTDLQHIARLHGGQQIKFGGDALLLYFGGPDHTERACAAALGMQQHMRDFAVVHTSRGDYPLTARIGGENGLFYAASMGRPGDRHEYIFSGPHVSTAIAAEGRASPGQVVAGPAMTIALAGKADLVAQPESYSLLRALEQPPGEASVDEAAAALPGPQQIAMLARYLPPPLVERITTRPDDVEMMGEHRLVTVVFVNFQNLDVLLEQGQAGAGEADLLQELHRYFVMVEQTVRYYGGVVARCDPSIPGDKLLILFGAPVSLESDPENAIRCALALNAQLPDLNTRLRQRIGIATGYVFSGDVGSSRRKEYTVIGNAANLAARLMTSAQLGDILASQSTVYGLEQHLLADPMPPIRVKGFSEPVQTYCISGWRATEAGLLADAAGQQRLIGRQQELDRLQGVMRQVQAGRGCVVAIAGAAGVGKSALNAVVVQNWREMGGQVYVSSCESYGQGIPYLPWQRLFEQFFGLEPADTPAQRWQKVSQRVSQLAPDWQDRLHVIARLLELPEVEGVSPPAVEIDPRLWQQQLHNFVLALLLAQSRLQPLAALLTALHWSDQASLELLRHVARNTDQHPLLLLLSYRSDGQEPPLAGVEPESFVELALGELAEADCRELAARLLGGDPSASLMEHLWSFSRGNPMYLKEMVRYLHDNNLLDRNAAERYTLHSALDSVPIPGSIERIIISRLDHLGPRRRQTVRLASVIGRVFPLGVLQALHAGSQEQLLANLAGLASQHLIYRRQPAPGETYAFSEPQVQEVAYHNLAFSQRRRLHRQLGYILEQEAVATQSEQYGLIAYHFDLGQETGKAFEYHIKAGNRAREAYANHEALYHYRLALGLSPRLSDRPDRQTQIKLHLDHGRVNRFLGQYETAKQSYEQGLALARQHGDLLGEAQTLTWLADLANVQGNHQQVLDKANYAVSLAEEIGDQTLLELSLEYVGGGYMLQGALDKALHYFERCLSLSRELSSPQGILRSLNNIGLIHISKMGYGPAVAALTEALQLARQLHHYFYIIILANNLGELHQELHDTTTALALHEEALDLARQFGVRDFHCDSLRNLAVDLAQQGDLPQAVAKLHEARSLAQDIGFSVGEGVVLYSLGGVLLASGALDEATQAAAKLSELAEQIGWIVLRQKSGLLSGLVYSAGGQRTQALAALQTAADLWEKEQVGYLGWQIYHVLGDLQRRQGRRAEAQRAFGRARQIIERIAASIADDALRQSFLQAPAVRQALARAGANGADQATLRPPLPDRIPDTPT